MERTMIKAEANTLEQAYSDAAKRLDCSVTDLVVEVVQYPTNGFLGLFKKQAIIVATVDRKVTEEASQEDTQHKEMQVEEVANEATFINDTIMPQSFVSDQDDEEDEDLESGLSYTADYDDEYDEDESSAASMDEIVARVSREINELFDLTCFAIESIDVSAYDDETLLVEFSGEDAALLIGKEGYRYKALSYMLFNWINTKYQLQLRLEIAEFLKNQEESVSRYLDGVCENIDADGRAQTKILDGVLVQIALKELRSRYPEKYVAIRSTRDGLKYIIVNDYNSY